MAADTPVTPVSLASRDRLMNFVRKVYTDRSQNMNMRSRLEQIDREYARTVRKDAANQAAANANARGDYKSNLQDPVVPVVAPQVEAAHGYLVDLFLTSYPIFPVVSGPELIDEAKQIETIMGNTAQQFQWVTEFSMMFRDGLKYNLMAAEVEWTKLSTWTVQNKVDPSKPETLTQGNPTETMFQGNKIKRMDLYNTIGDPRVAPWEIHSRGDYAGYVERITRNELEMVFKTNDRKNTMNYTEAMNSKRNPQGLGMDYYEPLINETPLVENTNQFGENMDWGSYLGLDSKPGVQFSGSYDLTTLYLRIIPREYGLQTNPKDTSPVIFKLLIVNGSVPIMVQRKGNAHNYLPIIFGQMIIDGHKYQTKSFADNSSPYQQMATSLFAGAMESQRRKVYDRMFYNPELVDKAAIDKVSPVARIPVKPAAYGRNLQECVYQVPYRDEGVPQLLGMVQQVLDMGDVASGQNRVQRGQFQKGNKTQQEFNTVMNNSDSRPRTMAVVMEDAFLTPLKWVLKMNILQYQQPGQMYHAPTQSQIEITPDKLRATAWQFQIADGVLPTEKLINPQDFQLLLNYAAGNPAAAAEWDLTSMIVYSIKIGGAKWVDNFRRNPGQQQQFMTDQMALNGPRVQPSATPAGGGQGAGTIGNG